MVLCIALYPWRVKRLFFLISGLNPLKNQRNSNLKHWPTVTLNLSVFNFHSTYNVLYLYKYFQMYRPFVSIYLTLFSPSNSSLCNHLFTCVLCLCLLYIVICMHEHFQIVSSVLLLCIFCQAKLAASWSTQQLTRICQTSFNSNNVVSYCIMKNDLRFNSKLLLCCYAIWV